MSITATNSSTASATSNAALSALSSNFNDFLSLLTTQLQNQDPSSPMDTSQVTRELAQFAGVQQQVDTNTNLTSLIQLSQGQAVLEGTSLIGAPVELNATTLPLQNSSASLQFSAPTAGPVTITVEDGSGNLVAAQTVSASAGTNSWTWNGQSSSGGTMPDGAYSVAVNAVAANGDTTPLSFTTGGTVTAVVNNAGTVDMQFGDVTLPLSDLATIGS